MFKNTYEELIQETTSMANKTQFMEYISEQRIEDIVKNLKAIKSCKNLERFIGEDAQIDE